MSKTIVTHDVWWIQTRRQDYTGKGIK